MNYTEFESKIKTIERFIKDTRRLEDVISCDGVINFGGKLLQQNIELLEYIFNDQDTGWIEYWIWELDFGERNNKEKYVDRALTVHDEDGGEIPMETIEDLYNILTSGD